MPVKMGCRWKTEGLPWAIGAGLAVVGGGVAACGLGAVDCSIGFPLFCSKVREPRLPMLPDPPPRDPPENPPPPPRALASETVGTPMSAQTIKEAISFLVITGGCPFGCGRGGNCLHHPSRYGRKKPKSLRV